MEDLENKITNLGAEERLYKSRITELEKSPEVLDLVKKAVSIAIVKGRPSYDYKYNTPYWSNTRVFEDNNLLICFDPNRAS